MGAIDPELKGYEAKYAEGAKARFATKRTPI